MAVVRGWAELSLPRKHGSFTDNVLFPLLALSESERSGCYYTHLQ